MKTYEKPRLVALSLSGNDMLCGGCGASTRTDSALNSILIDFYGDANHDGIFELSDAQAAGLFDNDSCPTKLTYEDYCKFTGASQNTLFTS